MTGNVLSFDTEADYRAAIAVTLAAAQRDIRIFDQDLTSMGLESRTQVQLLADFLSGDRARRISIVVHDIAPLQSRLPRLLTMLHDHAHQVDVRTTPENLRHLADCWVLTDKSSGTLRFHRDHARGKCWVNETSEIGPWWQRSDDLIAESEPVTPWSATGL